MSNPKDVQRREDAVVEAALQLEAAGATVAVITKPGTLAELEGRPALLVGSHRMTWLMFVAPDRRLTAEQREWAKAWKGGDALVVASAAEAVAAMGLASPDAIEDEGCSRSPSASFPRAKSA